MRDISTETDLRVRNGAYAWQHIDAESRDVIDDIMATLAPDQPYAYTVAPAPVSGTIDGPAPIPRQEFRTTRAGIRAAYEDMHRFGLSLGIDPIAEISTEWYSFVFGIGHGLDKATGAEHHDAETAVLFPTMGMHGITGELFWFRTSKGDPYTGGRAGPRAAEVALLARHNELIDAFRRSDHIAAASLFHADAQIGIRDYVNEGSAFIGLTGREKLQDHLKKFFERFKVMQIDVVERLATDWCVFSELRWIVEDMNSPGKEFHFYTAYHGEVRSDGLFASLIGHGTRPFEAKPLT